VRVLVLGGTGEGRALADRLHDHPGVDVVSSLAGRLREPGLPAGATRVGGFGGTAGLAAFLREGPVDRVVDATHPFATTITAHALAACTDVGVPLLVVRRPGWTARPGDRWERVPSSAAAALAVASRPPGAALLTIGRRDVAPFAADGSRHYVVRCIDPPAAPLPPRHTVVLARGPFTLDGERATLRRHAVTVLVTRHSGGVLTSAKLDAAREAGVPVVLVDRPPPPPGVAVVPDVEGALRWLATPS